MAGIIDYGSVRQFGLYHREYRFQDVDRMSTTIPEQRRKARHIAQNFAQIRDALIKGRRTPLSAFRQDPVLRLFDEEFERTKQRLFVHKVGFDPALQSQLLACAEPELARLRRAHAWFERARSSRGPHRVPDGLSWNAIYCARDLLRELPARLLATGRPLGGAEILRIAASSYASRRDRTVTPHRARMAREFQRAYCDLVTIAAQRSGQSEVEVLRTVARRSATINRYDRITGDSIDFITARLIRKRKKLTRAAAFSSDRLLCAPPGSATSERKRWGWALRRRFPEDSPNRRWPARGREPVPRGALRAGLPASKAPAPGSKRGAIAVNGQGDARAAVQSFFRLVGDGSEPRV